MQRKLQLGRYAKFSASVPTRAPDQNKKTKINFKKVNRKIISPPTTSTTTTTTPPPPPSYKETEAVMQNRLEILHDACKK